MTISIKVVGIEKVQQYLVNLPRPLKIAGMRAAAEYFIGDDNHGLKHQPARVKHDKDNPFRWTSEKQRRAYFATDGFGGGIPSTRTGALKEGWGYKETNSQWDRVQIANTTPYAKFVQGVNMQIGHIADKWRNVTDVIASNTNGAVRAARAAVNEYLARKG